MQGLDDKKIYRAKVAELGELLEIVSRESSTDSPAGTPTQQIVQLLLELHGEALAIIIDQLQESGPPGHAIRDALTQNELVAGLLMLHGLHPVDFETRVMQALNKARPTLHAHGGDVELLDLTDGVIRLKLQGSCHGCPSSSLTLKHAIEEALYEKAPDLVAIEVEGLAEQPEATDAAPLPTGLVQLTARGTALLSTQRTALSA